MRYVQSQLAQLAPFVNEYRKTLQEAWYDINSFLDAQLESDYVSNSVIAGIIAAPFIGVLIFMSVLTVAG